MPESLQWFADLYATHGYWVLFVGIMLENAGIPLPGETALLAAAFLSSPTELGRLLSPCGVPHLCGDSVTCLRNPGA